VSDVGSISDESTTQVIIRALLQPDRKIAFVRFTLKSAFAFSSRRPSGESPVEADRAEVAVHRRRGTTRVFSIGLKRCVFELGGSRLSMVMIRRRTTAGFCID